MGALPVWSHAWDAAIQATVHEVAITFGFQLFNKHPKPETLEPNESLFVPATCAVAAEHLVRQIRDNFFRQPVNSGTDAVLGQAEYANIQEAVKELHEEMFTPFFRWQKHVELPQLEYAKREGLEWIPKLAELAIMFLLYTEASSLRHTPELMWLIFWIMQHSRRFDEVLKALHERSNGRSSRRPMMWIDQYRDLQERNWWIAMGGSLPAVRKYLRNMTYLTKDLRDFGENFMRQKRVSRAYRLLNDPHHFDELTSGVLMTLRQKMGSQGGAAGIKADLQRMLAWISGDQDGLLLCLMAEVAVLDDGTLFLDRVIQPFFTYLTQQVFQMGHDNVESAKRVAYDDTNESCTVPEKVHQALAEMQVLESAKGAKTVNRNKCTFDCLLNAGDTTETQDHFLPVEHVESAAGRKAKWWGDNLFQKTFMERRTPFMVYRAFLRVYVFLVVYFHILVAVAFSDDRKEFILAISAISITHSGMMLISEVAGLYGVQPMRTTLPPVADKMSEQKNHIVRMHQYRKAVFQHVMSIIFWLLLLGVLDLALLNYRVEWIPALASGWWYISFGYIYTVLALEALRHSIAGYSLTSVGELLLGRLAADRYMAPRTNLATSQTRFLPNSVMWLCCFAIKIPLDYYFIVKPMEGIYDKIMRQQWYIYTFLQCTRPNQRGCNGFSFDWVLVVIAMAPSFLTVLYDTGVIYQVVSAAFGTAYGLLWQHLGQVRRWDGVVASFLKAPQYWADKCMSAEGIASIQDGLSRKDAVFQRQASTRQGEPLRTFGDQGRVGTQQRPRISYSASLMRGQQRGQEGVTAAMTKLAKKQAYTPAELAHVTTQISFMGPWNELVNDMRVRDLLSDAEKNAMLYEPLTDSIEARQEHASGQSKPPSTSQQAPIEPRTSGLPPVTEDVEEKTSGTHGMGGLLSIMWRPDAGKRPKLTPSRQGSEDLQAQATTTTLFPYLLPKAVAAGQVYEVLRTFSPSDNQLSIMWESYQWLLWLLSRTGLLNERQEFTLKQLRLPTRVKTTQQEKDRFKMLNCAVALIEALPNAAQLQDFQKVVSGQAGQPSGMSAAQALEQHKPFQDLVGNIKAKAKALVDAAITEVEEARKHRRSSNINARENAFNVLKELEEMLAHRSADITHHIASEVAFLIRMNVGENYSKVIKWLVDTLTKAEGDAVPENKEAQRILYFFLTSLHNPLMPRAPPLHRMKSLTTLTPHYAETVLHGLDAHDAQRLLNFAPSGQDDDKMFLFDRDGKPTGTLRYLHTVYAEDWKNFCERMKNEAKKLGLESPAFVSEFDFLYGKSLHPLRHELLMWACLRGQPLARTVRGMMAYQDALTCLAKVEYAKPQGMSDDQYNEAIGELVDSKFNYCVTSQILGSLIAEKKDLTKRWTARGLEALMMMFPKLQVAYVDSQPLKYKGLSGKDLSRNQQWSVLLQPGEPLNADSSNHFALENVPKKPVEVYRVRLPINYAGNRGVVLGEGKPENQNHAIIFCFGECIQTIDMNQDNVFAEALKIRNLLAEFEDTRTPNEVALVGFREWIISQDCGALADFAASTELTFGSLVQRVMTVPSAVRFHYGHPDVWNKRFIMYRGGVSKANKSLHVSEDVFGGYNCTLRGGHIKFAEYMSVGKGRDMGFDSINGFEAKISAGNGEQVMSRDVYRLGSMMDFFRLMSWYHTGNGFFINTAITMTSVKVAAFTAAVLALTRVQGDGITPALTSLQIVQLGSFSILVYAFTVALDKGMVATVADIFGQLVSGSLFFFIFRAQTSAANFCTTMRYGGAAYVATGRGFLLTTLPYEKIWQQFGRTHMYFGMDLALLLTLATVVRAASFLFLLPSWLVVIALLLGPFWFNPFSFETKKVKSEFHRWMNWMNKNGSLKDQNCWKVWHKNDMARARNETGQQTDRFWLVLWMLLSTAPTVILALAAVNEARSQNEAQRTGFHPTRWQLFALVAIPSYAMVVLIGVLDYYYIKSGLKKSLRIVRFFVTVSSVLAAVFFVVFYLNNNPTRARNFYILLYAMLQLLQALKLLLLFGFSGNALGRMLVDRLYFATDISIGFVLFGIRYLLSLLGIVNRIQGTLLFNTSYARQYVFEQDMKGTELEAIVVEARRRIKQQ